MSHPNLPPELLDHIVDFLHHSEDALKNCCLVSKLWIPRTRKHIFADIQFRTIDDLESWKAIFPDPPTSPACYTKTLYINYYNVTTAAAAQEDCSVSAFSSVIDLPMQPPQRESKSVAISLAPFHGFSPALQSLRVSYAGLTPSHIFDLICSFPLLEDLSVGIPDNGPIKNSDNSFQKQPAIIQPSSSPPLTGSLGLYVDGGMDPFVSLLLSLPNGLHFRNLDLDWHPAADVSSSTELVEGCCSTLESLKIDCYYPYSSQAPQLDLSKATKLRDVTFWCFQVGLGWILTALRTITHDHRELEWITLRVFASEGVYDPWDVEYVGVNQEWLELDCVLAQLCESQSTRVKVQRAGGESMERSQTEVLLPEAMAIGVVDLSDRQS